MANKVTKKEMFTKLLAKVGNDTEMVDFINHEIELLENKAKRSKEATRKPTKTQVENENIKSDILAYIVSKGSATIKDLTEKFDLSSQKVTPLVNALATDGKLNKVVEKRVATYSKA